MLPGSARPHYDGEPERRARYHALVGEGLPGGYAADDGVAIVFEGTRLPEVVTTRREAAAYRVDRRDGIVVEERLATRYLGGD